MAQLSALLDRVHDELPAVPEALALRALSDATKEFCTRTHAWQVTLPRISLREGTTTYNLYPDTGLQIVALKDVRLDGVKLVPLATETPRLLERTPSAAIPRFYTQIAPDAIKLVTAPVDPDRLTVAAAMTLALGATDVDVPDTILDEYGEQIAAGAKMRLVRQAGQPWSSPDAVVGYAGIFYNAVTTAKGRVMAALGEAAVQIEMRSWA